MVYRIGTDVQQGDIIQLNVEHNQSNSFFIIDNASPLNSIVISPDTLISATSVANSITCVRRYII